MREPRRMGIQMIGIWALVGIWTLLAGQASTVPVQMNMNSYRELLPDNEQTYIIHMDSTSDRMATPGTAHSRYSQLLQDVQQRVAASAPIHVYETVVSGFSARLTPEEAAVLRGVNGVLAVYPDRVHSLHTTRTPEFLGLNNLQGAWPQGHFGDDVIIGILDSGVWPERESFSDLGMGPVPARWKGICQPGRDWNASNCNNKLIGARYYSAGYEQEAGPMNETVEWRSARDTTGHGSHTSSTAAGSAVAGASLNGLANGTARGMAPKARIAMYKVCWIGGCILSDILAGFDQAVADGVDMISLSIGGSLLPFDVDLMAIGAFVAMEKGIFVSCSAGNSGPDPGTVENVAPWMMTVAASTLDRSFPGGTLSLGDAGMNITGASLYNGNGSATVTPTAIIYASDAAVGNVTNASLCFPDSLNAATVTGKIVVCMRGVTARMEKGLVVLAAGGAGMVLVNTAEFGEDISFDSHFLPAIHVGFREGITLANFMNATAAPVGQFQFYGTLLGVTPAPATAKFSSRGPNLLNPEVLKPDITAPGVRVLAAWTDFVGPTGLDSDSRRVDFNLASGTSMACPHVTGVGALLKSAHPDWSPTAIKSAMMTTASIVDNVGGMITDSATAAPGTPWEFGSGHVTPEKALDPGLVYDMGPQDYVNFICASNSNYTTQNIRIFTGQNVTCPTIPVRMEDMNYPSFSAVFRQAPSLLPVSVNMTRTVTNVGTGNATYVALVAAAPDFSANVTVDPSVLRFTATNETKRFTLQVTTVNAPDAALQNVSLTDFAFLVWSDGPHIVQSPISVTVYK